MAQPPSSPAPQTDDHGFDPLAFWIQYRSAIRTCVLLLLAGLVGYAVIQMVSYQRNQAAAQAFAVAKTPEQLAAFIREYEGMPSAGGAALLLAGTQRTAGQLDDALKTLNQFISKTPTHPLVGSAHLATASILEQQGKADDAITAYRRLLASDSRSLSAPVALLRLARIYKAQNKIEEAKSLYESLQGQFPSSSFSNEALRESQALVTPADPAAPAAPAGEGAPAAPAPAASAPVVPTPAPAKEPPAAK